MNTTAVIQIGNSDNKLTQREWSSFIMELQGLIGNTAVEIHFYGCSSGDQPHQNACWVIEFPAVNLLQLTEQLTALRKKFKQESVALMVGTTEFI